MVNLTSLCLQSQHSAIICTYLVPASACPIHPVQWLVYVICMIQYLESVYPICGYFWI